jgi:hypothetical protein
VRAATGSGDAGSAATAAAVKMSAADVEQKYGDVLPTIGCRAVMLLNELPLPQAHYRALLVAKLLCDLPSERAAVLANISAGAVRKYCARFPDGNIGEFAQIYPAGVTHARVPELEIQAIIEFIKEHCPARSGTPREHYVQLLTSEELYQEYQAHYAKLLDQVVAAAKADPKARDQAAMQTLLQKVEAHQRGLAFLSALQSPAAEPAAVRAFAGGVLPGPAQLVVDYVLEGLPSIPKPTPRSRAVFEALKAELPLSNPHNYYGQFDCSVCNDGRTGLGETTVTRLESKAAAAGELTDDDKKELAKAKKAVLKYHWHKQVLVSQRTAVDGVIDNLVDPTHAIVLMDGGSYDTQPNVDDRDKTPFSSLCLVVETTAGRLYIDVLCNDKHSQKCDYHYVRAALLHLLQQTSVFEGISVITFITDTSAKQFRSRFVWPLMGALAKQFEKVFRLLYRCEHHGHSLCDSHFGIVEQTITRYLNKMAHERRSGASSSHSAAVPLSPLSDAKQLAAMLNGKFTVGNHKAKYQCIVLDTIDRSAALKPETRKWLGVMKIHDVLFESPVKLLVRQLSTEPGYDTVTLRITNPWRLLPDSEAFSGGMCVVVLLALILCCRHWQRQTPAR